MRRSSLTPASTPIAPTTPAVAAAPVTGQAASASPEIVRRLVLAAALALGLALGPWWHPNLAGAADESTATGIASPAPQAGTGTSTGNAPATDAGASTSPHEIVISGSATATNGGKRIDIQPGSVKIEGFGDDHQYGSFERFVRDEPGTAMFVFLIVVVVFLVPLLAIALSFWYKVRKTRMHNETMLKLAERGVVSPTVAMEALAAGASPVDTLDAIGRGWSASPGGTAPGIGLGTVPLYEQARMIRRRTAWSDLRKGVILIAIGIGLSAYSMFDDGTPNAGGLICLFLGIGYCILWYLQDQPVSGSNQVPPAPPGGA